MPLTPEQEKELADLQVHRDRLVSILQNVPESERGEAYRVGQRQTQAGAYLPSFTPEERERANESLKTLTTGTLRYGVPAVTAIATGGSSIPAQIGYGSLSSLLGETGALATEGEDLTSGKNIRRIAGSTLTGAVPAFRNAPLRSAALAGAGNVAGEAVARGEDLSAGEAAFLAGVPLAPSVVAGTAARGSRALSELTRQGAETAQDIENIGPGVQATLGQAIPRFAGYEQRTAAKVGGTALNEFLTRQGESIARAIEGIAGVKVPNEVIADNVLRAMNSAERGDVLAQLGNLKSAYDALDKTRDPIRRQIIQESIDATERGLERSVVRNFMGGMPRPTRFVEEGTQLANQMQTARQAFSEEASRRYAPVNPYNNVRGFDLNAPVASRGGGAATSIQDEVQRAFQDSPIYSGGQIIPQFAPYFSKLMPLLQSQSPATLGELKAIRESLYDAAESANQAFGTPAQRKLQAVADKITQTINAQAPSVIGAGPAADLMAANQFYAQFRPRFDRYGVANAFASMERDTGQMAQQMIGKAGKQGLDTAAVSNYITLLDDLNAARVAGVPASTGAINTIRNGLLNTAITYRGDTPTINFNALSELVNNLENQTPGALGRLGLGSRSDLNRLLALQEGLQGKPGTEQLLFLLSRNQPGGAALAPAVIANIRGVQDVAPLMNELQRRAVGGSREARQALIDIRANEINDLLTESSSKGTLQAGTSTATRQPRLQAVQETSDPDTLRRYQTTLGLPLLNRIQNQVIPGFAALQRAKAIAAGAGTTVGGTAFEAPVISGLNVPVRAAGGKLASGLVSFASDAADLVGYQTLSRIFAQAGGATGLRNVSQQLNNLSDRLVGLSRPQAIQILTDYAENGFIPEKPKE